MPSTRRKLAATLVAVGLLTTPTAASLAAPPPATATPSRLVGVLPNGRLVRPAGTPYDLGDFPMGLAVSPDGRLAVAANAGQGFGVNGGFGTYCNGGCPYPLPPNQLGDPATPAPDESLTVVDLHKGGTSDVVIVPTSHDPAHPSFNFFSGRVAFNHAGTHLYATGGGNEEVYDWPVNGDGLGTPTAKPITGRADTLAHSNLVVFGSSSGYTKGIAVSPDDKTLLVLKEYDDELDLVDPGTLTTRSTLTFGPAAAAGGPDPYDVVVSPSGDRAWVSLQGLGKVAAVGLPASGTAGAPRLLATIPVGAHPTGMALSPSGGQLLVANSNDDTVSVIDTATESVVQTLTVHATPGEQIGSTPDSVVFSRDGRVAFVALAGDDAVAELSNPGHRGAWTEEGLWPAGWYPSAVAADPKGNDVLTVAAKGLGSRYPAAGPYPQPDNGVGPQGIPTSYYYDGNNMPGLLTKVHPPRGGALRAATSQVEHDLKFASTVDTPNGGPIPGPGGGPSPITHVVYIVRENRTFDQVFGDLGTTRSDVDGHPNLNELAPATPNAHGLASRYAISDRFFSDGEASVQGHWWTTAASSDDYTEKAWRQYYSPRNHPSDQLAPLAYPANCTLFQASQQKATGTSGTFTFRDYGELVGTLSTGWSGSGPGGGLAVQNGGPGCVPLGPGAIDPTYPSIATPISFDDRNRAADFLNDIGIDANGRPHAGANPSTHFLRNFSYLILPEDHTTGLDGPDTPRAEVAQDDAALGTIISALSRSSYWSSTAVFVTEDDSQDGLDHIDGHRNVLIVASPYSKHVSAGGTIPGYVGHRHYDQASVVHTMELILGLTPLSSYDQLAPPLYDLVQPISSASQLTPADLAPYEVAPPPPFIDEPVPAKGTSAATDRLLAESGTLDYSGIDRAGPKLEEILWRSLTSADIPAALKQELKQASRSAGGDD